MKVRAQLPCIGTCVFLVCTLWTLQCSAARTADVAERIFADTGIRSGLCVLVADDAELALELAGQEPVLVLVAAPARKVSDIREVLANAGMHGRITAAAAHGDRIPLIDNLAALVVADLDVNADLTRDELLRILRPLGKLHLKHNGRWSTTQKSRPVGADDWRQYHHDAAMTDRSDDLLAGPAHGIQWLAGDNSIQPAKMGVRVVGSLILMVDERGVVARDTYSGLPVWRREDLKPRNRYAFLADEQRVYLIPRSNSRDPIFPSYMTALDLQTGETVLTYKEGIKLGWAHAGISAADNKQLERSDRDVAKTNRSTAETSYEAVQARLDSGVLLQNIHNQMVAVDAATGKRLWSQDLVGKSAVRDARRGTLRQASHYWHHPLILDGHIYAVEGEPAPSWSYTHWPMGATRAIHCLHLKTGAALWKWNWPDSLGEPAAAYNMTPAGDWLGLMLRSRVSQKSSPAIIFVNRDGLSHKYAAQTPFGKEIGGGHSHARLLYVDGKVWVNGTTRPIGAIDVSQPGDEARWNLTYAKLPRPVGCTVTRTTPNYVFSSLTTYSLNKRAIQHTNAARSVCDVGATPAAGITFITPTQCFCAPYLPGYKAFHPRPFAGGAGGFARWEGGEGGSAARKADDGADWPMYMANSRRSNWTDAKLPKLLKRKWSIKPVKEDRDHPIVAEWRDNWYTQGPVTPVSIAEGAAVFALVDEQQVVAVDPASGEERWRVTVDGRIDTSPTIRNGLVYFGTRNGWVYALNRDDGRVAWRFFAAPRRDQMLAFGQLESRWPLHGSVLVEEDHVWAIAGRHNDTDGGLWWWRIESKLNEGLDIDLGSIGGRLGGNHLSADVGVQRRSDGNQSGANTPAVFNGKMMFLAGIYLDMSSGLPRNVDMVRKGGSDGEHSWWADNFDHDLLIPGNQGLLFDYTQMGGYKMPYYGFTQAPVYAYNDKDFIHAGGTTAEQHRGGNRGGRRTEVTRFRKFDRLKEVPHPHQQGRTMRVGAEVVWQAPYHESDGTGLGGLAVAGDTVLVGFSVENRDHWRARDAMPHRLRCFDYETGRKRQDDLPLPAKPVLHGVTAGADRVFVSCDDGSIVCFGQ